MCEFASSYKEFTLQKLFNQAGGCVSVPAMA